MNFNNKIVWITGASSGIGRALAIELSKRSVKIILSSRNKVELEKVKTECLHPKMVKILPIDLENYQDLELKTIEAISLFGSVDVLFNNGGISQRSLAKDTSISVDKRIMDINYLGTIL